MASAKIYQHLPHVFLAINRDPRPPERQHRIYLHFSDPHAMLAGETLSSSYGFVSSTVQYRRNPFAISVGLFVNIGPQKRKPRRISAFPTRYGLSSPAMSDLIVGFGNSICVPNRPMSQFTGII